MKSMNANVSGIASKANDHIKALYVRWILTVRALEKKGNFIRFSMYSWNTTRALRNAGRRIFREANFK